MFVEKQKRNGIDMGITGNIFENDKWNGCTSANGRFWYERCWTLGFLLQSYLSMVVAVAKEETWNTEHSSQQSNLNRCDVHCTADRLVLPVHQKPLIKGTFSPAFVAPSQYILYKVLPFDVYKNIPLIEVSKGVKESGKFLWRGEGGSNTETENKR